MFSQNLVLIASFQPADHFDFHPKSRTAMSPTRESIFPPGAMEVSSADPDILGPKKYHKNCIENRQRVINYWFRSVGSTIGRNNHNPVDNPVYAAFEFEEFPNFDEGEKAG